MSIANKIFKKKLKNVKKLHCPPLNKIKFSNYLFQIQISLSEPSFCQILNVYMFKWILWTIWK